MPPTRIVPLQFNKRGKTFRKIVGIGARNSVWAGLLKLASIVSEFLQRAGRHTRFEVARVARQFQPRAHLLNSHFVAPAMLLKAIEQQGTRAQLLQVARLPFGRIGVQLREKRVRDFGLKLSFRESIQVIGHSVAQKKSVSGSAVCGMNC